MKRIFTLACLAFSSFALHAQCNTATWLECSQMLAGRTISSTSSFSIVNYNNCPTNSGNNFQGRDDVYRFVLDKQTEVTIRLNPNYNGYGGNLGLFLLNNCSPVNCIAAEDGLGNQPVINALLAAGQYYVVVENMNPGSITYDIELNCGCTCSPEYFGFQYGEQRLCETFDQFSINDNITANSAVRWKKWSTTSDDAVITQADGGQQLRVRSATNYEPDVWMNLFYPSGASVTTGRYRLAFTMTVAPGKVGIYHIHHLAPNANGTGSNKAYKVTFYPAGTGSLTLGTMSSTAAYFSYTVGAPTDVMQILDLDNNVAELWINHEFVYSWPFNIGSPANSNALAILNFDAYPSTLNNQALDYTIDDICFTSTASGTTTLCDIVNPVTEETCIENGRFYETAISAACDLYDIDLESELCPSPCDNATLLECGQTIINQSFGGISNFSLPDYEACFGFSTDIFQTEDRVYKFELKKETEVTISLESLQFTELALILLDSCSPTHCIDIIIDPSSFPSLTHTLSPGVYYVVVENEGSVFPFNISLSCGCSCDNIAGISVHCENFESYLSDDLLSANSNRWHTWNSVLDDVPVTEESGNQVIRITNSGTIEPDIWMDLFPASDFPIEDGRYRLSFDMTVAEGKAASYYVHHVAPNDNGAGQNIAYRVVFNSDGSGRLVVGNQANPPAASFAYVPGATINVMQILDLNNNVAELWINHEFIHSWAFNIGVATSEALADINFDAHPASLNGQDFDYTIDNLCFFAKGYCGDIFYPGEICIKSGAQYGSSTYAICDLYDLNLESIPCQHICDYGGTFIYRGDTLSGGFDVSDVAPWLLRNDSCIQTAYNNNVPQNLYSDVYVFYQTSTDSMIFRFNNNGNPSTKCFIYTCNYGTDYIGLQADSTASRSADCIRAPRCFGQVLSGQPKYIPDLQSNTCSKFFYIVITGTQGSSYSGVSVTPKGPCPVNPPKIICGTTIPGVISGVADTLFSKVGGAYNQCYPGSRAYNGAEKFYKFTLDESKVVTITVDATALMGIFLYNFICGLQCIDFAENNSFDTKGKITAMLYPGTYYIVVDKASTAGSNSFSLSLDCADFSILPNLDDIVRTYNVTADPCIPEGNLQHDVGIYNNAAVFAPQDKIMFRYPDNNGLPITNPGLTRAWGSANEQIKFLTLEGDTSLFPDKCAYAEGDTFVITVFQGESGHELISEYIADYRPNTAPGVNATNTFQQNGTSLINRLRKVDNINFTLIPSIVSERDTNPGIYPLIISTNNNEQWKIWDEFPVEDPFPWLRLVIPSTLAEVDTFSGIGQEIVGIKMLKNDTEITRTTYLRLTRNSNPNLYQKFVKVTQYGICNLNPTLQVSASPTSICGTGEVILTANVGPGMQNMFRYKWSNGDSTYSTKVYPNANTTYTVTITNVDCESATKTATSTVIVHTPPAAPINPVNRTICQGSQLTQPLSVSLPAGSGLIVNWYNQPVGGTLVKPASTTYSPTNLVTSTFYAETKNNNTGCVSAQRTAVTLTVNPVPSLTVSAPLCAPDLSYSLSASTNGTSITANAGIVTPGLGAGIYNISQIPSGTSVVITSHFGGNNTCTKDTTVSFVCQCSPVSAPVSLQPSPFIVCENTGTPALQVAVEPGLQVYWYNQPLGGDVLTNGSNTTLYQPTAAGTYFAEARNPLNNCSSTRTPVILEIILPPVLSLVDTMCRIDLVNGSTYSVTFTSTTPDLSVTDGQLSQPIGNAYILTGVPVGNDVFIVAGIESECIAELLVQSPVCACPAIAPPQNPVNAILCEGEAQTPLRVNIPPGFQVDWYAQPNSGSALNDGINTPVFYPMFPGVYFAGARDATTGCTSSVRTQVIYQVNELPVITVDSFVCMPVTEQYNLYFHTDADLVSSSFGLPFSSGSGNFYIPEVPGETDITLSATFTATGCEQIQTIPSPGCSCPQVSPPVSLGNKVICAGDDYPELKVTVGSGQEALWYSSLSANQPLDTGNEFMPTTPGTYYVRTLDLETNCISNVSVTVSLSVNLPPVVHAGTDQIVCANSKVFLNGSIQGASSGVWTSTISGGSFFPNNSNNAIHYTPPTNPVPDFALIFTSIGAQAPCPERSDSLLIHINPLPTFDIDLADFYCSPDLQTGFVLFNTDATDVFTNAPYSIVSIAPQNYQLAITDIDDYSGFLIYLANGNCPNEISIPENFFTCSCPELTIPSIPAAVDYCSGDETPVLQPTVAAGLILKWYQLSVGGTPIFTGNVFPVPSGSGYYYMEVYDSISGCSSARKLITVSERPKAVAEAGQDATICPGTNFTLNAVPNVINETYQWSASQEIGPIAHVMPTQNTNYTLTVTTAFGCSDTDDVLISVWPAVSGEIEQLVDLQCYGELLGSLRWNPMGGTPPFNYHWSNDSTTIQIDNLGAGDYSISVTDSKLCADTVHYNITQPDEIILSDTTIQFTPDSLGSVMVVISGGVPPYQYKWFRGAFPLTQFDNINFADNLLEGIYTVVVEDENNCSFSTSFNLIYVPTVETDLRQFVSVSPNPTGGLLKVKFGLPYDQNVQITLMDVLGRGILTKNAQVDGVQDISLDLSELPSAMYLLNVQMENVSTTYRISLQK